MNDRQDEYVARPRHEKRRAGRRLDHQFSGEDAAEQEGVRPALVTNTQRGPDPQSAVDGRQPAVRRDLRTGDQQEQRHRDCRNEQRATEEHAAPLAHAAQRHEGDDVPDEMIGRPVREVPGDEPPRLAAQDGGPVIFEPPRDEDRSTGHGERDPGNLDSLHAPFRRPSNTAPAMISSITAVGPSMAPPPRSDFPSFVTMSTSARSPATTLDLKLPTSVSRFFVRSSMARRSPSSDLTKNLDTEVGNFKS